ncbi:MAG: 4-(cytidine 5'-diphospho)-2-C-methyl-D-erythritol kinase [Acidobacteria bacterium]|nr:4-(cytidine 5'-diphospho)-2-C-methyl-D-erythritol kinase [Acidobacteriota bacterium]
MAELRVRVPAKINLHLEVLGRRADGFHELRTLFQSVDLYDEVVAEAAPDGVLELEVEPSGAVDAGADNLVLRAARSLWEAVGARPGARLRLCKGIPVGGGLGGGSADAAASLVLLDRLWRLGLGRARIRQIAAGLGSDVPFFLHGGLALGVGRGEEVYELPDVRELGLLMALPGTVVPTAEVYRALDAQLTWKTFDSNVYAFTAGWMEDLPWSRLRNDLQPVVLDGWPAVAEAMAAMSRCGGLHAAVTGSGSAVFALFADPEAAREAAAAARGPWRLHVGKTLSRHRAGLEIKEG